MNPDKLNYIINTKIFPILLLLIAGAGYLLKLPDAYNTAIWGAGLLAFRSGVQTQ